MNRIIAIVIIIKNFNLVISISVWLWFHTTFSRYKQFGIKLSPFFGFAKSSKYKPIFPLSQIPKLLVACVTGGLFLSKLRLNRKFFTLLLAKSNFHVSAFQFVIFNVLFSTIYFSF